MKGEIIAQADVLSFANVLKVVCVICIAAIYRERGRGENEWGSAEVFLNGAAESHQEGSINIVSILCDISLLTVDICEV